MVNRDKTNQYVVIITDDNIKCIRYRRYMKEQ